MFCRTLVYNDSPVTYTHVKKGKSVTFEAGNFSLQSMPYVGTYKIDVTKEEIEFKLGGTYTVVINEVSNKVGTKGATTLYNKWVFSNSNENSTKYLETLMIASKSYLQFDKSIIASDNFNTFPFT